MEILNAAVGEAIFSPPGQSRRSPNLCCHTHVGLVLVQESIVEFGAG